MSDLNQAAAEVQANEGVAPKAPRVKLTPEQRLEKLKAKLASLPEEIAELEAEIAGGSLLDSVTVGTQVVVTLGKGDTLRHVPAVVIGIKDDEEGAKLYRVAHGTGFEADVATVKAGKLKLA